MTQSTLALVDALREADQDFEWYPTTRRMADVVSHAIGKDNAASILDVGAGDGRVLAMLAERHGRAKLYAIEKAPLLQQAQPEDVIPVGTEFFEQDLMSLPVDVVFSNPPYSDFENWAARIIETAHARRIFLILPQRWEGSAAILGAIKTRSATARIIHRDDFLDAERRARAVVHIVKVELPEAHSRHEKADDPFDRWFDQNIDTFDHQEDETSDYQVEQRNLARLHRLDSIPDLVAAFDEEYARMQENYRGIFRLDYALLKELGVNKAGVRDGLKKKMAGLKNTYWQALFSHLDVVTSRLTTKTKARFLGRLTDHTAVAFTESNVRAVVLWAIKHANKYFDVQLTEVFRELSTRDGVSNYKSNLRTWEQDGWRYNAREAKNSHYALDYRVVLPHYRAIHKPGNFDGYDYPGDLHNDGHQLIDDVLAVFGNLGFVVRDTPSRRRRWASNQAQEFLMADGRMLFDVRAFLNGNMHFRFQPDAIKALNVEAGRLLGWLRTPGDVVTELGYQAADATRFFGSNQALTASTLRLLGTGPH